MYLLFDCSSKAPKTQGRKPLSFFQSIRFITCSVFRLTSCYLFLTHQCQICLFSVQFFTSYLILSLPFFLTSPLLKHSCKGHQYPTNFQSQWLIFSCLLSPFNSTLNAFDHLWNNLLPWVPVHYSLLVLFDLIYCLQLLSRAYFLIFLEPYFLIFLKPKEHNVQKLSSLPISLSVLSSPLPSVLLILINGISIYSVIQTGNLSLFVLLSFHSSLE